MYWFDNSYKIGHIKEMLEQIEDIYTDLRMECLEMTRSFDELMNRISELEADKIYLEELLEEASAEGCR